MPSTKNLGLIKESIHEQRGRSYDEHILSSLLDLQSPTLRFMWSGDIVSEMEFSITMERMSNSIQAAHGVDVLVLGLVY